MKMNKNDDAAGQNDSTILNESNPNEEKGVVPENGDNINIGKDISQNEPIDKRQDTDVNMPNMTKDEYLDAIRQLDSEREEKTKKEKKKKRKRGCIGCSIVILLPIVICLIWYVVSNWSDWMYKLKTPKDEQTYQAAIEYVDRSHFSEARNELYKIRGYKYTDEALAWMDISDASDNALKSAESVIYITLKDPESYRLTVYSQSWDPVEFAGDTDSFIIYTTVEYSATNSFGGRVPDSYSGTYEATIKTYGQSEEELMTLIEMKSDEIVAKMKNAE